MSDTELSAIFDEAKKQVPQGCFTCKFYEAFPPTSSSAGSGSCRFFPPAQTYQGSNRVLTMFPTVPDEGWCGQWKYKEAL